MSERIEEIAALGEAAKQRRLGFHMDGARFANAVARQGQLGVVSGTALELAKELGTRLNATVTAQSRLQTAEQFGAILLKTMENGATVHLRPAEAGPIAWVERTLAERATMLQEIRRRFELLRAQRVRLRKL